MKKEPIVFRCPIIQRVPILKRVAIFHRKPLCSEIEWDKCKLCSQLEDCSGNSYVSVDDSPQLEMAKIIRVSSDFEDWKNLEQQIWQLGAQGEVLRLVTDTSLPKEIIWATSYSDKNIIQANINMLSTKTEIPWIDKLMSIANRCGVYCVLCLHPIVPGIVRTYHVIDIIDRIMRKGQFHITLKFCEIHGTIIEHNGWLNFNGHPLSTRYMEKTNDGWVCSDEYIQKFLKKLELFLVTKKLSVTVCSDNIDCTGLNRK